VKNKVFIESMDYLDLVGDGAIANSKTADGRLIPVLILDTRIKKTLEHLVNMHDDAELGDVTSIWAVKRFNYKSVSLVLYFENPIELKLAISFDVTKNASLIEGILISKAVYLQPGSPGDRIRHNINAPKILVEIPKETTFEKWDKILNKAITKKLKKEGVRRVALKDAKKELISITKDIWGKRLK